MFASYILLLFLICGKNADNPQETDNNNSKKENSISISNSDLIVNEHRGSSSIFLEAFKSSINDKIIREKNQSIYSQLKWFSFGAPKLMTINYTEIITNPIGFNIYVEMLNSRHRQLFINEIKRQYDIDVSLEQIKDLIPTQFECNLTIKCYEDFYLNGRVKNLREFPYRVDFDLIDRLKERECLQTLLRENNFYFECKLILMNKKLNSSHFLKTFILQTNQLRNISFDENILDRIYNIEQNLKRLNEKLLLIPSNPINFTRNVSQIIPKISKSNFTNAANITLREPTYKVLQTLYGHKDGVLCLTVLDNGDLVSGSDDSTIKIWNPKTGSLIRQLTGHTSYVLCLTISTNGEIISGSFDHTIKVWDPIRGYTTRTITGHTSYVNSLASLPNGYLASGSYDTNIMIWNPTSGALVHTLKGHSNSIKSLLVLPNGNLASGGGSGDNTIKIWNLETGYIIRTLVGHENSVNCLALLPDGSLISGGALGDNKMFIWNPNNGSVVKRLSNQENDVNSFAVLSNGFLLTASSDTNIRVWNVSNNTLIRNLNDHTWVVTNLVLLKNGNLVSSSLDRTVKIWDTSNEL